MKSLNFGASAGPRTTHAASHSQVAIADVSKRSSYAPPPRFRIRRVVYAVFSRVQRKGHEKLSGPTFSFSFRRCPFHSTMFLSSRVFSLCSKEILEHYGLGERKTKMEEATIKLRDLRRAVQDYRTWRNRLETC